MSDTSWGCQTVEECAVPTWEHAAGQVLVAAGLWAVFVLGGILWTTLAPFIDFDFRGAFGRYQYGLSSAGTGAGLCLTGIYMLQSITFVHRSIVGFVDPLLHAFEMLGTLIALIDVASRWAYVCCDGFRQLMVHAFRGALFVDCLVCTATVGLGISAGPPGQEKRTWWSLSFLASTHVFRCLACLGRGETGKSQDNFRRQILHVSVTVLNGMFLFAAIVMTLEILGPRPGSIQQDRLPGVEYPWSMYDALVWSVSLFTLLGNSERNPSGSLGQLAAVCGLGVAVYQMARIVPVGLNALTGRASFVGRYPIESRQHRSDGHTIITGSPTAKTLIEFLFEYYHPNHFAGGLDFEREARDVVVFLEDAKTLAHLRRLLDLKDASMFRSRVFLIKGETFQPADCRRAAAAYAKCAVILPNMQTSDVDRDDQANIMRTYAICAAGSKIRATCVLHSAQHRGSILSGSTPNSYFVSVDAIKMGMLGKACMFPGAITMICNLCVSVGEGTDVLYRVRRHWLSDYEHGLGNELYEVPLSTGYAGYTFMDAFEDVMVRSRGTTYLIGITDTVPLNTNREHSKGEREVLINPGPDYELKVSDGRTAGVFIAPELDAIVQVTPGEDPKISRAKMPRRLPLFEKQQQKVLTGKKKKDEMLPSLRQLADSQTDKDAANVADFAQAEEREKARAAAELRKEIDEQYEDIMLRVKKRFLEKGLHPDVIGGATNTEPYERKFPRSNVVKKEEGMGSDGEAEGESKNLMGKAASEALDKMEKKKQELEKLESLIDRCRRDAMGERRPPKQVLNSGGHILVCFVSDTEVSCIPVGSSKMTGAAVGIHSFMKALRDDRLELNQGSQPTVIFLGELQPSDWHEICHMDRVYFLQGSALRAEDLLKAGVETCSGIVIARTHAGVIGKVTKTADARVVLAATLTSFLLPFEKVIPITTDHAYPGSCELLPPERVFIEEEPLLSTAMVGPPSELPQALMAFMKGAKALARSMGLDGKPPPVIDVASLDGGSSTEKYEDMEVHDIKYHPRYLRGQVFYESIVTSMVASSMYNPNLVSMVDALIEAPMMMIDVPKVFYQSRFQDFALWLFRERGLLPLALYRSAEASQSAHTGDFLDQATPTHDFVYTAPPGSKTLLVKSDRVIVTATGTAKARPTEVGTEGMRSTLKKAMQNVMGQHARS